MKFVIINTNLLAPYLVTNSFLIYLQLAMMHDFLLLFPFSKCFEISFTISLLYYGLKCYVCNIVDFRMIQFLMPVSVSDF